MKRHTPPIARMPALIACVALLVIGGIGGLGYHLYEVQADVLFEHRLDELTMLGASQVAQIDEWVSERKGDVAVIAGTSWPTSSSPQRAVRVLPAKPSAWSTG